MQWVNGIKSETPSLSDRSIQFGDAVFRTMRKEGARILFWDAHYQKWAHNACMLGLECALQALFDKELMVIEMEEVIVNCL